MQHNAFFRITAGLVLCIGTWIFASPITRMDIYDRADNHLLFVTFEYNAQGGCVGRSVYASDSTFLRSSTFEGGGTAATKEKSVDYEGNALFTTTIQPPSGGKTSFSTVDQFGLSQYGSPLSYTETGSNTFTITQNNGTLCTQQYEYDNSGELIRITVRDKDGAVAWYAVVSHQTPVVRRIVAPPASYFVQCALNRGKLVLRFRLAAAGPVRADLYAASGRRMLCLAEGHKGAGNHTVITDAARLGNGTYILKMTTNGTGSLTRIVAIQK